jgi:hypothetical protein
VCLTAEGNNLQIIMKTFGRLGGELRTRVKFTPKNLCLSIPIDAIDRVLFLDRLRMLIINRFSYTLSMQIGDC